jgi:hypothetical protein
VAITWANDRTAIAAGRSEVYRLQETLIAVAALWCEVYRTNVVMQDLTPFFRNAFQDLQILEIILHLEKHRVLVMASLHDMGRNVG